MATYKKNEVELANFYRVEIDYYLDETVFNGEYLKNKDGQLVYFGLQNVDGDYLNKLSDADLTNCITSSDDNYTIKLEKVDNTAAKIFVNKPKKKLTLDKRHAYIDFYYIDSLNNKHYIFNISYFPKQCSYKESVYILQIQKIANSTFSFNNLYYVVNYNGTGGVINLDELKKASTIDITSNDLNKTLLYVYYFNGVFQLNINKLIYTYYSYFNTWYINESGYTPINFLTSFYDKIYTDDIHVHQIYDYSQNKITVSGNINQGTNKYLYFCAINPTNNTVVPVFKMYTYIGMNRKEADQKDVYTKYIVK